MDKRILYEWTGIKLDGNGAFEDDSSADEITDVGVFIDNMLGYSDDTIVHPETSEEFLR